MSDVSHLMKGHWDIEEGRVDSIVFFRLVPKHFPEATTFFAEGTAIEKDVQAVYDQHKQEGEYLPGAQTIWPRSRKYLCAFSPQLFSTLAALAERHAEAELLSHLAIYAGQEPLLLWHDAFANAIVLSLSLPEERIRAFADALKLPYAKNEDGKPGFRATLS